MSHGFRANINDRDFLASLAAALNTTMLKAAEPLIQAAMKDIEREMRQKLAAQLVGMIEGRISMERRGVDLRIILMGEHTDGDDRG